MRVLFVHQNMPGQFKHLARKLAQDPQNEVVFITRRGDVDIPGVLRVTYTLNLPEPPRDHSLGAWLPIQALFGEAVVRSCQALATRGFSPDIIIGHPGWGELLFVKDLYPDIPLLSYAEFYHDPASGYFEGDPPEPSSLAQRMDRRAQSAHLLLSLEAADRAWSPTEWQRSTHPTRLQSKIDVVFDGVDTDIVRPDVRATFHLPNGRILTCADEVVTYVARALEPCRGFPQFMRAVPAILATRPQAQIVIAGAHSPHYDQPPPGGGTWLQHLVRETGLNSERVHLVGRLEYANYLRLLQVSKVHVYLTTPIVLSWSLFEALSAGCYVVASDTAPVRELIEQGLNGRLFSFADTNALTSNAVAALEDPAAPKLKAAARRTIENKYSLDQCVKTQVLMVAQAITGLHQ